MGNKVSTAAEVVKGKDLTGKHIVVTGSSGGIGEETVKVLYYSGATVIMASRNKGKMEEAEKRILAAKESDGEQVLNDKPGSLHLMELDLADLKSVEQFTQDYKNKFEKLHILINNAGQMANPDLRRTVDGFEAQIGVNHFGHFALTMKLLDLMKQTADSDGVQGRVVNVSSMGHKLGVINFDDINYNQRSYSPYGAYGQSKLANILMANELQRRLKEDGVNITANSLHPGVIATELGRDHTISKVAYWLSTPFQKSIPQGAATTVYCAVADELQDKGGLFFDSCAVVEPNSYGKDMNTAAQLFTLSEKLTNTSYPFSKKQ